MNQQTTSKTSLFLMELIIAITFFAISSAVCVRLFVSAHLLSQKNYDLTNAVMWTQNLAEVFYGTKGDLHEMSALYSQGVLSLNDDEETGSLVLFFDENWDFSDASLVNSSYEAIIQVTKENASDVYKDVTEYQISYKGKAYVGQIAIIDLKNQSDVFSSIPDNEDIIINQLTVDQYIGKEE
ncbi:hypothetical protein [Butyrivibrio proteoclasticus]|uniref:hypothetical protein n=1 Tax=Butyrivibrio proteoclasticus TaxID=43305 RepID=UPI00047D86C9|nr:hypothetical protein [Butyrivibrio proteoclasticus]